MKTLSYHVMLRWEPEDEVYTAWVPSLHGCVTFGKTIEEALEMARDAIELYVETLISLGEAVPSDESVIDRTVKIEAYA
jgi:predicted RNase H-like HicB family nuclease